MSKDLDEMLKESPTLTFEPFPTEKNEIVEVVEETPVEDVGETLVSETALEIVEPKPKKTRKKKEVVVEETDISEEPINEVPEQTETTEA